MVWRFAGFAALAFFLLALPLAAEDPAPQSDNPATSLLINTAQDDAINILASDSANGYLFSASADGSVNVYGAGKDLVQHIQVSTNPLIQLAASGDGKIAVLEKGVDNQTRLSVWNWPSGRQLWHATVSDQVLSIAFSARNSYVVLSLARWNSLLFLESGSGKAMPWLQNGLGIIDYALVSSKEERLLSYRSASGIIGYHELASGKEIKLLNSKPKLRQFQIVPDLSRTKACAIDGNKLVIVDLLSGKILDSKDPGFPVNTIIVDETNPTRIIVVGGQATSLRQQNFQINPQSGALSLGDSDKITLKSGVNCLGILQGQIFAGDKSGLVLRCAGKDVEIALADHVINKISSLGFSDGSLYLSGANGLFRVQSELFNARGKPIFTIEQPKAKSIAGFGNKMGMLNISERELLLWDKTKTPKLYRFDTRQDAITRVSNAAYSSFVRVKNLGDQCLIVDAIGLVRTLDYGDFRTIFSHSTISALSADMLNKSELIVGKGTGGNLDSALLRINQKTGETVRLPSDDMAVFLTKSDPKTNSIYYLASSPVDGVQSTIFKRLAADQPNSPAKTILRFPGEDLEADIVIAPQTGVAYTSAGGSLISACNAQSVWALEDNSRMPRELKIWGNLLLAVNSDGGITVWDTESRHIVFDLFITNTGSAFFITRNGDYGLIGRLGSKLSAAEENRDRNLVESLLSLPIRLREKNAAIKPVQFPCQLLP